MTFPFLQSFAAQTLVSCSHSHSHCWFWTSNTSDRSPKMQKKHVQFIFWGGIKCRSDLLPQSRPSTPPSATATLRQVSAATPRCRGRSRRGGEYPWSPTYFGMETTPQVEVGYNNWWWISEHFWYHHLHYRASPAVLHISKSVNRPWGVLLDIRKSCVTPFVAPERAVWCSHVMSQSIWRCGVRNKRAFQTFLIRSSSLCLRLEATCVQTPGLTLVTARQAWHATH